MSFTKKIINIFVIYYINNIQTVIQGQIDLEVHCFYLEITWKILEFHGTGEVGTLYLLFYFFKAFYDVFFWRDLALKPFYWCEHMEIFDLKALLWMWTYGKIWP